MPWTRSIGMSAMWCGGFAGEGGCDGEGRELREFWIAEAGAVRAGVAGAVAARDADGGRRGQAAGAACAGAGRRGCDALVRRAVGCGDERAAVWTGFGGVSSAAYCA